MLGHGDIIDGVDRPGSDDFNGLKSLATQSPRHEIKGRNNVYANLLFITGTYLQKGGWGPMSP